MDENNINIKEILEAASGADEHGYTKSAIGLFSEMVNADGNVVETVKEVSCKNPIVKVHRSYSRIFVDLTFATSIDIDLNEMVSLLNDAFSTEKSIDENVEKFSLVTLSIIPAEYDGLYYMVCTDPAFWALTSETPGGHLNVLRFVFDENDFYILQASEDELEEIRRNVDAELEAEERQREWYEEKATSRRF